jgi:hypothetical protein
VSRQGDLVFCHGSGIVSAGIRFAERVHGHAGAQWNHVAILDQPLEHHDWTVIQAEAHGVTRDKRLHHIAPGGVYEVVPSPAPHPETSVAFAKSHVGDGYGFVTIASILATLLTPRFFNVMLPGTWICSALAAESLRAGGWLRSWPDIYTVTPAELYDALVIP